MGTFSACLPKLIPNIGLKGFARAESRLLGMKSRVRKPAHWLSTLSMLIVLGVGLLPGCEVAQPTVRISEETTSGGNEAQAAEVRIIVPPPIATIAHADTKAENTAFTGVWAVTWCEDPILEDRPCGGFHAYLSQVGNRICGTYEGVDQRANRLDTGEPRSIIGTIVESTAVITVKSERNHGIYLATAKIDEGMLSWDLIATVKEGTNGEPALIADGDKLTKSSSDEDTKYLEAAAHDCAQRGDQQ